MSISQRIRHPASWVPSAYLAEGIPFAMTVWVAGTMFKNLGHSDTQIALVTGSVGIAWSLKPLWAAFLDMFRTKKFFVLAMELLMAGLLVGVGMALKLPSYLTIITVLLWVLAFSSATQDICVDGIYITALDKKRQAAWQGTQSAFWNVGRLFGTAAIVYLAGKLIESGTDKHTAWTSAMILSGAVMGGLALYHFFVLPTGAAPARAQEGDAEFVARFVRSLEALPNKKSIWPPPAGRVARFFLAGLELVFLLIARVFAWFFLRFMRRRSIAAQATVAIFADSLAAFFLKKAILGMLIFVFLYRSGEGFLLVLAPLFMQSSLAQGGLGLSLSDKSFIDGTMGTVVSVAGALAGGMFVSKYGLKRSLLFLALCMNIPHICYIALSHMVTPTTPLPIWQVYALVSLEKFGYNFGFVGNMLYMMQQLAPGKYKMTHYAFATSLMNLVLVPTQSISGKLADMMGYKTFFIFVLVASIPSVIAAWKAPFPNPPDVEGAEAKEPVPGGPPPIAPAPAA